MHPISLYVHLPFCREKCGYCDFLSFAGMGDRMPDYVNALVHELQSHGITLGTSLDTVLYRRRYAERAAYRID